jgi:hypothetical protein
MMTVAESRQMIKKLKHIRPLSGVAIVLVLTTSCASRRLSAGRRRSAAQSIPT